MGKLSPTPLELVDQWLADLQPDHSATTLRRYASVLKRFFTWYEGEARMALALPDLNPIVLVGYRNAIQTTEATSTVNTHVSTLRSWGKWLKQQGYMADDPAARLKLVKRPAPTQPRSLTSSQVNALLRETQHNRYPRRDQAILQVLIQTGMRIGECAMLCYEDICFGEKHGSALIRSGKGNKARRVPLNSSARQALADYVAPLLGVQATLKEVAAAWPCPGSGQCPSPLWRSQRGRMTVNGMERMVSALVKSCAARDLVPAATTAHSLRHTFATRYLVTHRGDYVGLARLLGHSSLEATKIYVQPTEDELTERVERLDLNAYGG
ncbi:MAG: integrase [Chloroflexi bacterium]|nr:MAG: integrase [Chloroflexota bacterium]